MESKSMNKELQGHDLVVGYLLWIFGFTGAHRFYFGKPITGTLYFFTAGLLGVGWLIDLFLIPSMERQADIKFKEGQLNYNIAWLLLTFLGIFGAHRFYQGKFISGIIYFFTAGFFAMGIIYDYWTLNDQISLINEQNSN